MTLKNIYVVTHAQSVHHVEEIVGGWHDTGLTELGKTQAAKVATRLRRWINTDDPLITSSDLKRAVETAGFIGSAFDCKFQTNADLREISYGLAEGKPQKWLDERISYAPHDNRLDHLGIEGGETKREFISRVYRAVDVIIADDNPTQIIVTHGFALTFVIARWIGMPVESAGYVNFRAFSGGITHLQQDTTWNNRGVKTLSDTTHLVE